MVNETKCPECGGSSFGKGKAKGEGRIYPIKKFFTMGSEITHVICTKCGFIVKSFVVDPEKFEEQ
ncbi:transcription initiation factor TFIIIB [Paenibacillus sp. FSL H7-0331]|jgi:predicted nucleic-acid-binding Zn-ribbon protein|uniref:transcription initiation factor TFIIIB n=1 Tax=Paenibacillus sp. FSL H7-0331 TaxID=1920421 RepID=UPI00096C4852|nr:transcription initiation factor TFIIIB [Paenibacillus sp. FSL H7-0331]OME94272.1 transcription initiation factor TFIIIB [Paenibacillus sp. FSL H7-0331]